MKQHDYIYVLSRRGHYNFADSSQETVSTHIAICESNGTKKLYCNITTPDEVETNEPFYLVEYISEYLKRYISSQSEEVKIFHQYLKDNEDNLCIGNLQKEKKELLKKQEKINERLDQINKVLAKQGYFEKGVWVEV